jgi:hypothetical protein
MVTLKIKRCSLKKVPGTIKEGVMKNTIKMIGFTALVAVIGLSISACKDPEWEDITEFPAYLVGNWKGETDGDYLNIQKRIVRWQDAGNTTSWEADFKSGRLDANTNTSEAKLKVSKVTGTLPEQYPYTVGQEVEFAISRMLVVNVIYNGQTWVKQ